MLVSAMTIEKHLKDHLLALLRAYDVDYAGSFIEIILPATILLVIFDTNLNSADVAVEVFDVNVVTGSGTQQKVRIFQLVTTGMTHTTRNSSLVLN